jgi:hypothetical protein
MPLTGVFFYLETQCQASNYFVDPLRYLRFDGSVKPTNAMMNHSVWLSRVAITK